MKSIHTITTAELESLEHKYRNPATIEESCILRGVKAEIQERDAFRRRETKEDFDEILEEKNDEIDVLKREVEKLEDDLEVATSEKVDELEEKLRAAEDKLEKLKEIANQA